MLELTFSDNSVKSSRKPQGFHWKCKKTFPRPTVFLFGAEHTHAAESPQDDQLVFHFIRQESEPKDQPQSQVLQSCWKRRKIEILSCELSKVEFMGASSVGRLTFVF